MAALRNDDLPYYSYDDYIQWEGEWELIDGIAYAMSPAPVKRHQMLCGYIFSEIISQLDQCLACEVLIDADWKIDTTTILKPDVAVVCRDKNPKHISKTPEIIFEVISPSTAKKDEGLKYTIYEEEGVRYYILIYPDDLVAKIYHLSEGKYRKIGEFDSETADFEDIACPFSFDFDVIFKRFR
ncbi:MAG TPA: Uma2 family endonuclease [Epsilonproteobacteria bacterium]|nr:Uma2 family endonuclease [Campylobacterota bacterium]